MRPPSATREEVTRLRTALERLIAANDRYTVRQPGTTEWLLAAKEVDDAQEQARAALDATTQPSQEPT